MGKLSQLFGLRKKDPEPAAPLPNINTPLEPTPTPWEGNLPCVFSPTDGCSLHNPTGTTLFFDPLLFPPSSPPKPSSNHRPSTKKSPPALVPIHSTLPRDFTTGTLTPLPRVHKSVPYSLTFYHAHHLTSSLKNNNTPPNLSSLSCSSTTGRTPALSWAIRPVVISPPSPPGESSSHPTLLLEYFLAFCIKADLGSWTPQTTHGRAVSKEVLIGSGYRDFTPCAHTRISYKSHRGDGKSHVRTAGVTYVVVGSDGVEKKGEWRSDSDEELEVGGTNCGKCCTDVGLKFEMDGDGMVTVGMQIHKDLGRGEHPGEDKWLSLVRGGEFTLQRQESDFGRMKRLCEERDEEVVAAAAAQEEVATEQGEEEGK